MGFLALSFGLMLFSLLNWIDSFSVLSWKASVVSKEFGHWFALICLVCIGICMFRPNLSRAFASGIFLVAMIGFAKPVASFLSNQDQWQKAIGEGEAISPFFSWSKLFLGTGEKRVEFQRSVYRQLSNVSLNIDRYPAQGKPNGAWLLVVHGGGWDSGNSEQLPELNSYLANRGYSVFSIDYRLAPEFKWPAQKEDAIAAIEYIRAHAKEWNIDPKKWAILGRSAGAQIAGVVGYAISNDAPKAVVGLYGPTDMTFGYEAGSEGDILESRQLMRNYMGGAPLSNVPLYEDASMLTYIDNKTPPTLLLYGESDNIVWHKHGERLYMRLQNHKVRSVFIDLPWGTHGFDYSPRGPGGQVSTTAIEHFLEKSLL